MSSVDAVVEQGLTLLSTATALVRCNHFSPPSASLVEKLRDATNELDRAAQVAATGADSIETYELDAAEFNTLRKDVQRFTDTVNERLNSWKYAASTAKADIAKLRRVENVENIDRDTTSLAKKGLELCKTELLAFCAGLDPADTEHASTNKTLMTTTEHDVDQDLRNPIAAGQAMTDFPFQHLQAADILVAKPIWEWLLNTLPSNAQSGVGVFYRRVDLRQMLLKCVVCVENLLQDTDICPELVHLTRSCVTQLSDGDEAGARENDVLRCVADAFATLFLYTVNLDGHFADPATNQPLSAAASLDLLRSIEWPRQKGDKSGPKFLEPSVAVKIPSASGVPPNTKAHGFNPAIWAMTNWSLRVGGDPAAAATVRQKARRGAHVYRVFAEHLVWALNLLPPTHCTVYRGIKGRTTRPYVQNTVVAWPAFSSTSTKDREALNFMGKEQGTFFIVHCNTARDIAFCSWYPNQAELLLPPSRQFKVQSRVSNTVLTMLESNSELIVMREHATKGNVELSDVVVATQAINAVSRTVFIFDAFIRKYVPGRFTTSRGSEVEKNVIGIENFASLLSGDSVGTENVSLHRGTTIVGDGGSGKTSAMLYFLSSIATGTASSKTVPVFVSLPALQIWNPQTQAPAVAPIDAFVCSALGLASGEQLAAVASECKLVVLLDSLDEVPPDLRHHLHNSVSKNPLIAAHATKIVLSTRSEALPDARAMMTDIISSTLYCLPFTMHDVRRMLDAAAAKRQMELGEVETLWNQLEQWRVLPVLSNPFVASMCIDTALADPALLTSAHATLVDEMWHPMKETTVYEAYLQHKLCNASDASDVSRPRFQQATNIACQLTSMQTSHATIEKLGADAQHVSSVLRFESLEAAAPASFRHKSLQEYLVARAICAELSNASPLAAAKTLLDSLPRLSRTFPNAIRLAATIIMGNKILFDTTMNALGKLSCLTNDVLAASTSLAILVQSGHPLSNFLPPKKGLSGVTIADARLDSASFTHLNMEKTTFKDCILTNTSFIGANVSNATIQNCKFGELPTCAAHTQPLTSVRFTPDGEFMVSAGGWEMTVRIHRTGTGERIASFSQHSPVNSVDVSPDGDMLVVGFLDSVVKILRRADGAVVSTHKHHDDEVKCVRFSPCGKYVASSSCDKTVVVLCVESGEVVSTFSGHTQQVDSVAFSPSGELVASGSFDSSVRVHRVGTGEEVSTFTGHSDGIFCVAFSANGKLIASGSVDSTVRIHNFDTGDEVFNVSSPEGIVYTVAFSPDGKLVASGDTTVRTYRVETGEELSTYPGHTDCVLTVAFSPDGRLIASGGNDMTIKVHEAGAVAETATFTGHTSFVQALAFSPDGSLIASGSWDKTVQVHRTNTGAFVSSFTGHSDFVNAVAFSAAGELIASGASDKTVLIHDVAKGTEVHRYEHHCKAVTTLAFSPDGNSIASGSEDETVHIYRADCTERLTCFNSHSGKVDAVVFSPCGTLVCSSCSSKNEVFIFRVETGEVTRKFDLGAQSVAFAPNSKHLALATHKLTILDLTTTTPSQITAASSSSPRAVVFSPDGRFIVSGGFDRGVQVHSADSGEEVAAAANVHTSLVTSIAFGPTGSNLFASGSLDKTVNLYCIEEETEDDKKRQLPLEGESSARAGTKIVQVLTIAKFRKGRYVHVNGILNKETSDPLAVALLTNTNSLNCSSDED